MWKCGKGDSPLFHISTFSQIRQNYEEDICFIIICFGGRGLQQHRGNLLSKVEYHDDDVFEREEYHYSSDGELALVTRVIYFNNTPDSSWTEYEIRRNGQIIDTIETINSIKRKIKSSDGSVRSYRLVGDEWKETSFLKFDEKGMDITENAVHVYDKKEESLAGNYMTRMRLMMIILHSLQIHINISVEVKE